MPLLRILYISHDLGRAETFTAAFASRDEALAALSACGIGVLQIAELSRGESGVELAVADIAAGSGARRREVTGVTAAAAQRG
jgi:hypothetical protein